MSYIYRPPQSKTFQNSQTSTPKSIKEQTNSQQQKIQQSVLSIIGYIVKSNQSKKVKQSFNKIKSTVMKKKKHSEMLAKRMNSLFKQKHKQFAILFFSSLVSNKISSYNKQMNALKSMKQNSKIKATAILFYSIQKLFAKKTIIYFNDLRAKSTEYSKNQSFKATHLFARLCGIYRKKLSMTLNQLGKNNARLIKVCKLSSKLQHFVNVKNKRNTVSCFNVLKTITNSKSRQTVVDNSNKSKNPSANLSSKQSISQQQQKRQLQTLELQLKTQLTQLEHQSTNNNPKLTTLKSDISRLQKQSQSLKFNNQLLQQNNSQLQSQLQTLLLRNRRKLSQNQVWENVYNNLIYFLSMNRSRNRIITKEQLIQAMELPLVPCGVNLEEINEENKVLQELLDEYKKNFPQPETSRQQQQPEISLPYDLLRKKNKYYYMVLEVLAEWGAAGNRQLEQLNNNLQMLQHKLCEQEV